MSFTEADRGKESKYIFKGFVTFILLFIIFGSLLFPADSSDHLVSFPYFNEVCPYSHFYAIILKYIYICYISHSTILYILFIKITF